MSARVLSRIQTAVRRGQYDLTYHAVEEMAEDDLGVADVETAILDGQITRTEADDPRGPKYTLIGPSGAGESQVGVVGRFKETGIFLVITVYEVD